MTEQPAVQYAFVSLIILLSVFTRGQVAASTSNYSPHAPIVIKGNSDFTALKGVTSGTGTALDPYVIQGWEINASSVNGITLVNTTAFYTIMHVNIHTGVVGIFLDNVTNGLVHNSVISGNGVGIILDHSTNATISNNIISNNRVGITEGHSLGIVISDNIVSGNQKGILLVSSPRSTVSGNSVTSTITLTSDMTYPSNNLEAGIFVSSSSNSSISRNMVFLSLVLGGTSTFDPKILHAISLNYSANVLVSLNTVYSPSGDGINVRFSQHTNITGNNVTKSLQGILLYASSYSTVSSNYVYRNAGDGVLLSYSDNITLIGNSLSLNAGYGINCCGRNTIVKGNNFTVNGLLLRSLDYSQPLSPFYSSLTIALDNLINGKPLQFLKNCANVTIDGVVVGAIIVANCSNILIKNLQITHTDIGVQLVDTRNAVISDNSFNSNTQFGISLTQSPQLVSSATNITILNNNLSNNGWSASPALGIVSYANPILVHHNNFIYDTAKDYYWQGNYWDNGYPSGGNYWYFYQGIDKCSGPGQNICPDPDGIGDTPFSFSRVPGENPPPPPQDRYPLMTPYLPSPDRTAPTWPIFRSLTTSLLNPTNVTLTWIPATDDIGVVAYKIYQGTTLVANLTADQLSYVVRGLNPGTTYTFSVQAVDWSGNTSSNGPSVTLTTRLTTSGTPWVVYLVVIVPVIVGVSTVTILVFYRKRLTAKLRTESSPHTS